MVEASSAGGNYEVPYMYRKNFNPEQISEMLNCFKNYDKDKSGTIDAKEFKGALVAMGHTDITDEKAMELLKGIDKNNDGVIEWLEFLDMMQVVKNTGQQSFGQGTTIGGQAAAQIESASGAKQTYLLEEVSMIARAINRICKEDELLQERLPINPDNDELFHALSDGMVLLHLMKHIDPDLIDMRTVNKGSNMNIYKVRENLDMAIKAASSLVKMFGIGAQTFLDKVPNAMLAVLLQVIRILTTKSIQIKDVPELYRLAEGDEDMTALLKLPPESILIRWVNFHLKAAGQEMRISNLGSHIKDGKAMLYVLNQLDKDKCPLDALEDGDDLSRVTKMIANSAALGVADVCGPQDFVKGNPKVNSVFVAEVFNTRHGLEELTKEEYEAAGMIDDDIEGGKHERMLRMWINSLQIPDCFIVDLFEDLRDGVILLRVIHRIDETLVNWKAVRLQCKNVFDRNGNCDLVIDCTKKMNIVLVGAGSADIRDGNKKLTTTVVWELMTYHYLKIIGSKTEKDLIGWFNESLPDTPISAFNDAKLGDGTLLIKLCGTIEPRVIN